MALDLPLPKHIFGHPWLNTSSGKMSKSKGNTIYADDLIKYFGRDGVRYYVLAEMPYKDDGIISYDRVISRYNTDLANIVGNLNARTLSMTHKYFGGKVPSKTYSDELSKDLEKTCLECTKAYVSQMEEYRLADAIESVISIARRANKYIDDTTPWALAKDESKKEQLATVIYDLLESLRFIGVLLHPIMPDSCDKILSALKVSDLSLDSLNTFGVLESDKEVDKSFVLFQRLDEQATLKTIEENE